VIDQLIYNSLDLHAITAGVRMVDKVTGLVGFPDPRDTSRDRPEGDGAIESPRVFLKPRVITIEGVVFPDAVNSAYTNWRATQKAVLAGVRTQQLLQWRTTGSGLDLQALCRVAGSMQADLVAKGNQHGYEYQLMLRAADPIAYASTGSSVTGAASGASITITNAGDAPTYPVISVHGPATTSFTITNTTQSKLLKFLSAIGSTSTAVIDTNPNTRSAKIGATDIIGTLDYTVSDWFAIQPGATETITLTTTGVTAATILSATWRNAYTG
jgi:hypothetical protein